MAKTRDDRADERPRKMSVDFGVISRSEEQEALEESHRAGTSLHILRFAHGATAIASEDPPEPAGSAPLSLPAIAKSMLQAYAQVGQGLKRHLKAPRQEKRRGKAQKKGREERGALGK